MAKSIPYVEMVKSKRFEVKKTFLYNSSKIEREQLQPLLNRQEPTKVQKQQLEYKQNPM